MNARDPFFHIVDYGIGNIASVRNVLDRLGTPCRVSADEADMARAVGVILPGVGAFAAAMDHLRRRGLVDALTRHVLQGGKPYLGICLGMQILARDSDEGGQAQGLGWIDSSVRRVPVPAGLSLPHVGWNSVWFDPDDPLFAGLAPGAHFYFDHSYCYASDPPETFCRCDYGVVFPAAVRRGNILGVQFHPEKSQRSGMKLLRNFTNFALQVAGAENHA